MLSRPLLAAVARHRRRLLFGNDEGPVAPYLIIDPDALTLGALGVDTTNGVQQVYNSQPSDYAQIVVSDEALVDYTQSVRQDWTALACGLGNQNLGMRFGFSSLNLSDDLPPGTNHVWVEVWQRLPVGWDQGAACGFPEEKFFQVLEDRPVSQGRWEITTGGGGIRTGNPADGGASMLVNRAGNHPDYIPFSAAPNDGYVPWDAFYDGEWHRFGIECQFGTATARHRVWAANRATNEMVMIHDQVWDADTRGTVGYREWNLWASPMNQTPQATQSRHGLPVMVYTQDPGWPTE